MLIYILLGFFIVLSFFLRYYIELLIFGYSGDSTAIKGYYYVSFTSLLYSPFYSLGLYG